jgi:uncharacterized protein YqgC (DUF456 family)
MLTVLTAIAIVVGIAGTLLPFVPGIGLVWAAILVYVIVDGFGSGEWVLLMVVTVIGALGIYYGFRIPQKAATDGGLGWQGQLFAATLAVVGFFVIPVVGAPIGFVVGVYAAMLAKDRSNAWSATKSTLRSFLVASGIQLGAASLMGLVWLVSVVTGWAVG